MIPKFTIRRAIGKTCKQHYLIIDGVATHRYIDLIELKAHMQVCIEGEADGAVLVLDPLNAINPFDYGWK